MFLFLFYTLNLTFKIRNSYARMSSQIVCQPSHVHNDWHASQVSLTVRSFEGKEKTMVREKGDVHVKE